MQMVSNTYPLSALSIIGRLGLLRAQFGNILILTAVWTELSRLEHAFGKATWPSVDELQSRLMSP